MKKHPSLFINSAAALLGLVLIAPLADGQTFYDQLPGTPGLGAATVGGGGSWDLVFPYWTIFSAGTGPNGIWPNTNSSHAIFSGTRGTVTVTAAATIAGLQVHEMEFRVSGYIINAEPGASLKLALAPGPIRASITLNPLVTATLSVPLTGEGFIKKGVGDNSLVLFQNNVFTGGVYVDQGEVKLTLGGKITDVSAFIGTSDATLSSAQATVDGPTSKWTNTSSFFVGNGGFGNVFLRNGGELEDVNGFIGSAIGSNGSVLVTGAGSLWKNTGKLTIGEKTTGALTIENDGDVTAVDVALGQLEDGDGTLTIRGGGSMLKSTGNFDVGGLFGKGTVRVETAGILATHFANIGSGQQAIGSVTVNGTASRFTADILNVGDQGDGTLRVENDGDVETLVAIIGADTSSSGRATITGPGSKWTNTAAMTVGNFNDGTLNVEASGEVATDTFVGGSLPGGNGQTTVTGLNSRLAVAKSITLGDFGTGGLQIQNAGRATTGTDAVLGVTTNGIGTAVVDGVGSQWDITNFLIIGGAGNGSAIVRNGGRINVGKAIIGQLSTTQASVNVAGPGSTVAATGTFVVGDAGAGALTIVDGGLVTSAGGTIGNAVNGVGVATISGPASNWNTGATGLTIGNFGAGQLVIVRGATVTATTGVLGFNPGSSGAVVVQDAGSAWNVPGALYVGGDAAGPKGTGLVKLDLGGRINSGPLTIWNTGVLEIGSSSVLNAPALTFNGATLPTIANTTFPYNAVLGTNQGNGVIVDSASFTSTFSGMFSGPGGLTKINPGRIILTGINTYTGDTTINGGDLIVNGSIASLKTLVNPLGLLGGTGVIGGNVFNHGVVSPGLSPGKLTIIGNYTQFADGTLRIEVAGTQPGQFDQLAVGGSASLAGRLQLIRIGNFEFERGDRLEILTAAGGVNGKFKAVEGREAFQQTGRILTLEVIYEPNAVVLELVQGSFADFARFFGLTPNQRAVARALDSAAFDSRAEKLIAFLNGEALGELPRDFDRIAPEELTAIFSITLQTAETMLAGLEGRLADARAGANGFRSTVALYDGKGQINLEDAPRFAGTGSGTEMLATMDYKSRKDILTPERHNRWGVWVGGTGEFVNVGNDFNATGYDFQTGGVTIGLDYRVSENLILGVAGSYAHTGANLIEDGDVDVDGGRLALYGTWHNGGAYVNAIAGGGYNNYDTHRRGLRGFANGDTSGAEFDSLLGGGYDLHAGAFTFGPTASVAYTYVGIDGYQERGSLAPLAIADQDEQSLRTRVGGKVGAAFHAGRVMIRPEVSVAWQHEHLDDSRGIGASFANGAGTAFTVQGPSIGRDSAILGVGLSIGWTPSFSTYLAYEGEVGRDNYDRHTATGGVRVEF